MKRLLALIALFLFTLPAGAAEKPRLVVLISIDQFRADYLTRFEDLFLPPRAGSKVGGFRWLMTHGAYFPDAHHDHLPLGTGPGHAVHFTGAPPYKSGIVANDWYDRTRKADVYCVQDDNSPLVGPGAQGIGISPDHLRVTTIGDELKMATGGQAKVFAIALKDRAAVLMAGHLADCVYWFDDNTGNWISSRYYRRDGTLPSWISALNAEKIPHSYFGKTWTLSVPETALRRLWTPNDQYADNPSGLGTKFPHPINGGLTGPTGRAFFRAFTTTPYANQYVFDSAKRLIREEQLGQDEIPDVLAINLSSNDYIGHAYGPDSPEALDVSVQTDRQLSGFLNDLNGMVSGGLASVTVVVTADHGVAPNGQAMRDSGMRGGVWSTEAAAKAAEDALDAAFGADDWVVKINEPYLWLNHETLARRGVEREKVELVAAAALEKTEGIYAAYPRHRILVGALPRTDIAKRVGLGYHPQVSGDIVIISAPFYMPRSTPKGTTHAEPYTYDTRVPLLLAGSGIRAGTYTERVSTLDIAPTLSFLLSVQQPSGCEGRVLPRAVAADGVRR